MMRKSRVRRKAMRDWNGDTMRTIIRFMPPLPVPLRLMLALRRVPPPGAQLTLCTSKFTRDQCLTYKIKKPQDSAMWVNGYYHGKRGDVALDTQKLVESARKLRDYCRQNRQTLVLEAVETLFAKER